jgi:hypothetical protein
MMLHDCNLKASLKEKNSMQITILLQHLSYIIRSKYTYQSGQNPLNRTEATSV